MPKATLRANALALPRRLFLASGSAAAVFTALGAAACATNVATPISEIEMLFGQFQDARDRYHVATEREEEAEARIGERPKPPFYETRDVGDWYISERGDGKRARYVDISEENCDELREAIAQAAIVTGDSCIDVHRQWYGASAARTLEKIEGHLAELRRREEAAGLPPLLDESNRLYDITMDLAEQILEARPITAREWAIQATAALFEASYKARDGVLRQLSASVGDVQ